MNPNTPKSICGESAFLQQNSKPYTIGGGNVTQQGEMYACKICGNIVEVVSAGSGVLVCCGQPMQLVKDDD